MKLLLRFATALIACVTLVVAAPEHLQRKSPGFRLEATKAGGAKPDFRREWVAAHRKWGKPSKVASMMSLADDNGVVEVHPIPSDAIYVAPIEIGNPPQTLNLALDTGSSDLWVQSTDTVYDNLWDGPKAPPYKPNASITAHRVAGASWTIEYVDGAGAQGIVYSDTLRMGGFEIDNMAIQSAQQIAFRFENVTTFSGIMGLAKTLPSNISPSTPTLLDRLRSVLAAPVFTVDLRHNATGLFTFGHLDLANATDNMTWVASDASSPHWDVGFDLTRWNGSHPHTWWRDAFEATIDTGTSLVFLPDRLAALYWADVPGWQSNAMIDGAYTFPCANASSLPDLLFKLPGTEHVLTVPGRYMNYGPLEEDEEGDSPGYCWGGLQSAESLEVTIIGDVVLKALLVAFDIERKRVGFANKKLYD